jgi:hypothetical protein
LNILKGNESEISWAIRCPQYDHKDKRIDWKIAYVKVNSGKASRDTIRIHVLNVGRYADQYSLKSILLFIIYYNYNI